MVCFFEERAKDSDVGGYIAGMVTHGHLGIEYKEIGLGVM
jgi:hypothetical protein